MEEHKDEICDCGLIATWVYMPCSTGNSYYCDNCVPRGCSCNSESFEDEAYFGVKPSGSNILEHLIEHKSKFRIVDNKLNGEDAPYLSHKSVVHLDSDGREYPCCEFMCIEKD